MCDKEQSWDSFSWQAQYLASLGYDTCCSAHCKKRFMCDKEQSWDSFSWQAQYLVSLGYDTCCSAHCKKRFMCGQEQSWDSFFVAGAIFGEFGLWHVLIYALQITFHAWQGAVMGFIFRGRRNIWWVWTMTRVDLRIANKISCVLGILDYDTCCSAQCK